MKKKVSFVVPCYNEEESIPLFYDALVKVVDNRDEQFEIIFINDGSVDSTQQVLESLAGTDKRVKVISFSRNFGQQAAIFCGFEHASGDCAICMDVDLQDPIDVAMQMIEKWNEGCEIVHGRRTKRKGESLFKKVSSKIYLSFLRRISGLDIPQNVGEFKLLDRRVIDVVVKMPELKRYIRGLTSWVGFRQGYVDFERPPRTVGSTWCSFGKLLRLAGSGIISFSTWPLTLAAKLGIWFGVLSGITLVTFSILAITGIVMPIWAWAMPSVTILFSITWFLMGLSNIYLRRVYEECLNRPRFIVSRTINMEEK